MTGYIVIENGPIFSGTWVGGKARAGEIVFNTSHNGYEEIATDPSYYGQIMVMTATQQGNYGVDDKFWESRKMWIQGFVCLDLEPLSRTGADFDKNISQETWAQRLDSADIPAMTDVDTRSLVLYLREHGTQMAALVQASSEDEARKLAQPLIADFRSRDTDWANEVSHPEVTQQKGDDPEGPKVAVIDFGSKANIIRALKKRCSEIYIFPCRTPAADILATKPEGVLLSNGPGSPANVQVAVPVIQELLGQVPIFGICMGHQLLGLALGGSTFALKFGHRGANHPVKNLKSNAVYMTSQNHGYAISDDGLPPHVKVTHRNLNDQTISGIEWAEKKCFSVQFHPESHPGPREAEVYFDQFISWMER